MSGWKDNLRREIEKGGTELPCPFCHLPRIKRSDYIRCARCGINWMDGEMLDRDPRRERLEKFLTNSAQTATAKKKEDRNG